MNADIRKDVSIVSVFVCELCLLSFKIDKNTKVVLGITIEMTSCEIFMSMKITEHWLKVLWKQQVLSLKQLT